MAQRNEIEALLISIQGEMEGFNRKLDEAVRGAMEAGEKAGAGFSSRFNSQARRIDDGLKALEAQFKRLDSQGNELWATLGQIATAMGVGGLVKSTIELGGRLQQTEIAFETLLGSAQLARQFLGDLAAFAAKTPFEVQGLRDQAQRLMAIGFGAKEVIPLLTAVGDAAAATGKGEEGLNRITYALGQIQSKGKASAEEIGTQLGEIIPAWRYLAEATGQSIAEVRKQVEKGALDSATTIKALIAGMTRDYGGMMERQAKTLNGQLSNLRDTATTVLEQIGKRFIEAFDLAGVVANINKGMQSVVAALKDGQVLEWFEKARGSIGLLAGAITALLMPALAGAVTSVAALAVRMAPLAALGAGIVLVLQRLGVTFEDVARFIALMGQGFVQLVELLKGVRDAMVAIGTFIGNFFKELFRSYGEYFSKATSALRNWQQGRPFEAVSDYKDALQTLDKIGSNAFAPVENALVSAGTRIQGSLAAMQKTLQGQLTANTQAGLDDVMQALKGFNTGPEGVFGKWDGGAGAGLPKLELPGGKNLPAPSGSDTSKNLTQLEQLQKLYQANAISASTYQRRLQELLPVLERQYKGLAQGTPEWSKAIGQYATARDELKRLADAAERVRLERLAEPFRRLQSSFDSGATGLRDYVRQLSVLEAEQRRLTRAIDGKTNPEGLQRARALLEQIQGELRGARSEWADLLSNTQGPPFGGQLQKILPTVTVDTQKYLGVLDGAKTITGDFAVYTDGAAMSLEGLRELLGVSRAALGELKADVLGGAISWDEYKQALQGMLAIYQDQIKGMDASSDAFTATRKLVEDLEDALKSPVGTDNIGEALKGMSTEALTALLNLSRGAKDLQGLVGPVLDEIGSRFPKIGEAMGDAFAAPVPELEALEQRLNGVMALVKRFQEDLKAGSLTPAEFADALKGQIADLYEEARKEGDGPVFEGLMEKVRALEATLNAFDADGMRAALESVPQGAAQAWDSLAETLSRMSDGEISDFIRRYKDVEGVSDAVSAAVGVLQSRLGQIGDASAEGPASLAGVMDDLAKSIQNVFDNLKLYEEGVAEGSATQEDYNEALRGHIADLYEQAQAAGAGTPQYLALVAALTRLEELFAKSQARDMAAALEELGRAGLDLQKWGQGDAEQIIGNASLESLTEMLAAFRDLEGAGPLVTAILEQISLRFGRLGEAAADADESLDLPADRMERDWQRLSAAVEGNTEYFRQLKEDVDLGLATNADYAAQMEETIALFEAEMGQLDKNSALYQNVARYVAALRKELKGLADAELSKVLSRLNDLRSDFDLGILDGGGFKAALEGQIAELEKALAKVDPKDENFLKIQRAIAAVRKELGDLADNELSKVLSRLGELRGDFDLGILDGGGFKAALEGQIAELEKALERIEPKDENYVKVQRAIAAIRKEMKGFAEAELERVRAKLQQIGSDISNWAGAVRQAFDFDPDTSTVGGFISSLSGVGSLIGEALFPEGGGKIVSAVMQGVGWVVDGVTRMFDDGMRAVEERTKQLGQSLKLMTKDVFKAAQEGYTEEYFFGLIRIPKQRINEDFAAVIAAIASTLEGGILSSLRGGIKRFLSGAEDWADDMRKGIRGAIEDAIIESFITGAIIVKRLGPILEKIVGAVTSGNKAALRDYLLELKKAIPEIEGLINEVMGPIKGILDETLPVDAFAEKVKAITQSLSEGITSGFRSGFQAFFDGDADWQQKLSDAIRSTVEGAIIEAVITGAVIKGAFGKLLEALGNAMASGDYTGAAVIIQQIGAALPGLVSGLEAVLGPFKDVLDQVFPKKGVGKTSVSSIGLNLPSAELSAPDWARTFSLDVQRASGQMLEASALILQAAREGFRVRVESTSTPAQDVTSRLRAGV